MLGILSEGRVKLLLVIRSDDGEQTADARVSCGLSR